MNVFEGLLIIIIVLMMLIMIIMLMMNHKHQQNELKTLLANSEKENKEKIDDLKYEINQSILEFENGMVKALNKDMTVLNNTTSDRLYKIESKVNDSLNKGFEQTNQSFLRVMNQMAKINETQIKLDSLSEDIASLQNVLNDKKSRGTFGEVELYSILESVYGNDEHFFKKQYKLSNGFIADSVLFAPDPLGKIVIDSKFPLENFNHLYENNISNNDLNKYKSEFRKDIKTHIKAISSKYLIEHETAEIAFMFIPSEAIFAEIYGHYEDLVQLAYKEHVYMVSATTLMAYITAIKAIYLDQKRNEKVKEIQEELIKLSKEFELYNDRYMALNKDFNRLFKDFEQLSITNGKISERFRAIEDVKIENRDEISVE